jgi:hypothetical protein
VQATAALTDATIVWVAPAPPDAGQRRALATWASAHDVRLVEPAEETPRSLSVDLAAASEVEARLDSARDAIAGLDAPAVDRELATAEALLRAHAELPQAGWLMAEVERTRAIRFRRVAPTDSEAADRALARAEAIDGGRAPGMGEEAAARKAEPTPVVLDPGPAPGDAVWLDGRRVDAHFDVHAGLHVALVMRDGAPIWASWIDVLPGQTRIALDAPRPAPCSRADVAHARVDPTSAGVVDAAFTRCPRWVAAAPGSGPREIVVASCSASRCAAPLAWRLPDALAEPPAAPAADRRWPAWATWGVVGAGAAVAATVVLGAVLHSTPAETRYVSYGIKPE